MDATKSSEILLTDKAKVADALIPYTILSFVTAHVRAGGCVIRVGVHLYVCMYICMYCICDSKKKFEWHFRDRRSRLLVEFID